MFLLSPYRQLELVHAQVLCHRWGAAALVADRCSRHKPTHGDRVSLYLEDARSQVCEF